MYLPLAVLMYFLAAPAPDTRGTDRGVHLFQSSEWAKAKAEFSAAVQRNDRDARAHYYLGRLALIEDDLDAATEQLERAVKLEDTVSAYHQWYGKAIGQLAMRTTQPLLAGRMKSEYEKAIELDARNIDARDGLLDFYSLVPALMGGSLDKAREQAEAIARIDPMRGHLASGRLAMRSQDGPAVEREMNAAITAAPDSLRGYSALANWYMKQKEWPKAFATLDRYVTQHPDDRYGTYGIGRVAAASGLQLERGEQGIRTFLAKPPQGTTPPALAHAYVLLGQVLEHQGKQAQARSAFEQAMKLDPRSEEAKKAIR